MVDPVDQLGPPIVGLPGSFDRRMRLGPFPSVRDALKFATYAAVGAIPAALVGPVWWIPFLGGGFLLATFHPAGAAADDRAGEFLAYHWRRRPRPPDDGRGRRRSAPQGPTVPLGRSTLVAMLEADGTPVAFLPPGESRAMFDGFRDLLRSVDEGLGLVMGSEPIDARPFRPAAALAPPAPAARTGYAEMVEILCQRRRRRRVLVLIWVHRGAGAAGRLERSVRNVVEHLGRIGIPARRLTGGVLSHELNQLGWEGPGAP